DGGGAGGRARGRRSRRRAPRPRPDRRRGLEARRAARARLTMPAGDPLGRLVLRTPRLELRVAGERDVDELLTLARAGVHPPGEMPFAVAWTDGLQTAEGGERFRSFYLA